MGNYEELKKAISALIKENGNQEITGNLMQYVLNSIVSIVGKNATFAGIANTETNPGTPDQNVFYLAYNSGVYLNFNAVNLNSEVALFVNKNGTWKKQSTGLAVKETTDALQLELNQLNEKLDNQINEIEIAKDEAIENIQVKEDEAINNFNSQRVTPEMLSESTIQLINSSGGGSINNMPDDEDIQSVDNGLGVNVLKFANRNYNPVNYIGMGYVILRKNISDGKNVLTQSMISQENTIYEIKYDFDLNNIKILLPKNSILFFNGGSLVNFKELVGNYTKLIGNVSFGIDINNSFISGNWVIDRWEADWFGAIADGTYPGLEAEELYPFGGTDNYNAIQAMLNCAYKTNVNTCHIKAGFYRVTKPLNMGYCDNVYNTCRLIGENSYNNVNYGHRTGEFGTILLIDHDYYGISVNAGRGSSIENILVLGKNYGHILKQCNIVTSASNPNVNYIDVNSYIGEQISLIKDFGLSRYAPYAGIITDGTNWTDSYEPKLTDEIYRYPTFPNAVWDGVMSNGASSRTILKNCAVLGFGVGVGFGLNNWWGNNEFNVIDNCQIVGNVYGLVQGNGDARHTAINNTIINISFVGIDTCTFGTQKGSLKGLFLNCNFDSLSNIFNVYAPEDVKMINCYAESIIRLGKIVYTYNRQTNMVIRDSTFMLKPDVNNSTPIPDYYIDGDNILIDNSRFLQFKNMFVIKGTGNNIQIRDSKIYSTAINDKATPFIITGARGYEYNPKLINSSVLDSYVTGNVATSRNNYLYVSDNYIGNIKKIITKTQGWAQVTESFDNTNGILTLTIPAALNNPEGKVYKSDLITNNKTGIVFIITDIEKVSDVYSIQAKILNGYKIKDNIYELMDDYKGDYFSIICTRQVPLKDVIDIINIDNTEITLNKWNDLFVGGAIIDVNYDNSIQFVYPQNAKIVSVDKSAKKITLSGNTLTNSINSIKGVIVIDDLFLQYLNIN